MRRAEVIERTLNAATLAEPHLPAGVGFSADWRTNGRAGFNPRRLVNHTTEDAGAVPWPNLYRILKNGWGSLSGNALYNSATRHDTGRIVVLASGTAWHAGAGSWRGLSGNAAAWGHADQRGSGQSLTAAQREASRVWNWALTVAFNITVPDVCEHFEWAPGRKQDRLVRNGVRIDAAVWRSSIRPPATPTPPDQKEDDDMTPAQAKMLEEVHAELCKGRDTPPTGGTTTIRTRVWQTNQGVGRIESGLKKLASIWKS